MIGEVNKWNNQWITNELQMNITWALSEKIDLLVLCPKIVLVFTTLNR